MKPPERLLGSEELDPEIAHMLRVARQPRAMTHAERARAASRFARAFAIPAAAGSLLLIKSAALAGLIGAAGGLVVATGTSVFLAPDAPSTAAAPAPAPRVVQRARALVGPREADPSDHAATAALPDTSSSPPVPSQASPPAPSVLPSPRQSDSAGDDALGKEALLLEQARAALANDPARTLRLLETHRRLFPAGRLTSERELLRVDALGRLGRAQEARALAESLLRSSSGSLYEERLRKLEKTLGDKSSPSERP
jgi:hypothetical protein